MNKQLLINQVKEIILKHTKPERIYVYGSQINGEATLSSDIDIAYYDKDFKKDYLIDEDVSSLNTLIKIDVKNIAFAEDRFKNRVKDTGKVIYSQNKKLRAEDGLWNFSRALDRFTDVVYKREEFKEEGMGDYYLDIAIKRFEFTYEMSWKAIKRLLDYLGIEQKNPRDVFKEAYEQRLIEEEDVWLDMIESRNLSSHTYDQSEMIYVLGKLKSYKDAFIALKLKLEEKLK